MEGVKNATARVEPQTLGGGVRGVADIKRDAMPIMCKAILMQWHTQGTNEQLGYCDDFIVKHA